MTNAEMIEQFRKAFGFPVVLEDIDQDSLYDLSRDIQDCYEIHNGGLPLNFRVFFEEVCEYVEARMGGKRDEIFAEGLDVLYTIYGDLISKGFSAAQIDEGFRRVHQANMSKLGDDGKPIYNEYGKAIKGPNYKRADLSDLVE